MNRMLQDDYFANEIYERYFTLRQTVLHEDTLSQKMDSIADYLSDAQARHFTQWDLFNDQTGDPDTHVSESYEDEIAYLKGWILERLTWLDYNMTIFRHDDFTSNSAKESPSLFLRIFPNPAYDQVYIESNEPLDKIEVMTTEGKVLFAYNSGGKRSCTINVQSLNPGMHFIRITIQNRAFVRKIIKM
jgi:hypothetical protein